MKEENKPGYMDIDWTLLAKYNKSKWNNMWKELIDENKNIIKLWDDVTEIPFYKDDIKSQIPSLAIWPIHKDRGMIIICPGGGFLFKSSSEAKPVAQALWEYGYNVAILDYRVEPYKAEVAAFDASRAVRYLKYHASELGIDENHIAIGGFSAGGVLTTLLNINGFEGNKSSTDPLEQLSCRPDAEFLIYGAFPTIPDPLNEGQNKSGGLFTDWKNNQKNNLLPKLPANLPPTFLMQTDEDDPHNILNMALELANRGVEHEVHLFQGGPHGGGLYNMADEDTPDVPHTAAWLKLAAEWFDLQGF